MTIDYMHNHRLQFPVQPEIGNSPTRQNMDIDIYSAPLKFV